MSLTQKVRMQPKRVYLVTLVVILGSFCPSAFSNENGDYNIGVGIADVTGPSADIGMMGYANLDQSARGIHTRLFSRAFVFQSGNGPLAVYVSADIGMVGQGIKYMVVKKLQEKYGNERFTQKNVLLSGTHTHSGPAAYLQYLLYSITSLGFNEASFNAIVDGMVQSIERANDNMKPAKIFINKGRVDDANANRSPTSYQANPPEWKQPYGDDDVDKDMTLVRIEGQNGPLGSINWFAVHPTSMNNTNRLISGDNKGFASMKFEYKMNPTARPGKGEFVAAFAASNLGDVSPNTKGAICIAGPDQGKPCDAETSTCPTKLCPNCPPLQLTRDCIAFGPGDNMEESTKIIGEKQFDVAMKLFNNEANDAVQLKGSVGFIHQYVDMRNYTVQVEDPRTGEMIEKTTCPGALGYSFAGGTTDGPGMFDFKQGTTEGNAFWDLISGFLKRPSPSLADCHAPKPILLAVGEMNIPYDWVASVVETQILRIGNLYLIGIPGELTTMSGRRMRETLTKVIKDNSPPDTPEPHVVIAGLANVYTHYIATFHEYQKQRYEAASTLYGPYTLDAYLTQYSLLAESLIEDEGRTLPDGPPPINLLPVQLSLIAPIVMDSAPLQKTFGDVLVAPVPEVGPNDTVRVQFVGAHPRHSTMREGTFLIVEKDVGDNTTDKWEVVATDADWSTKFRWSRPKFLSTESVIDISWEVPVDVDPGFYRIRHFGMYKPSAITGTRSYIGKTGRFKVVNGPESYSMNHPEWDPNPKKPTKIRSTIDFWRALTSAVKKSN